MAPTLTARALATRQGSSSKEMYLKNMLTVAQVSRSLQADLSDFTYLPTTVNVPQEAPWPAHLRGESFNVNYLRQQYRKGEVPPEYVAAFDNIRFVWNSSQHKWTIRLLALEAYKRRYNDLRVPHAYVVPHGDDAWPKDTWGMQLGHTASNIRAGYIRVPASVGEKLNEMGFVWDMFHTKWEINVAALQVFKATYGHTVVPQKFVAPKDWPPGSTLGVWVNNVRKNVESLSKKKIKQLNQLGFVWKPNQASSSVTNDVVVCTKS
ncbi:hypothetical protein ACHHYP_13534 [Achlya hypogyna]|uniref:Helicase-associated domain-containing protein n=1 Tax=Achlya hypogyna TaxID=1202772 RepID=A0A1V9YF05_ACHHY|nr:hypothetical protein ACHHYP_13534 [Achlya hypogyna]